MSLLTILLIVLLCAVLFGGYGHGQGWGHATNWSPVGLVVVILLVLVLTGRIH